MDLQRRHSLNCTTQHQEATGMGGDLTVAWARWMVRRNFADTTRKRRSAVVARFERWLAGYHVTLIGATTDMVESWLDTLAVSPQTRGHYLGDLACFYGWAQRHGHRADDPTEVIDPPLRPQYLPHPISGADLLMAFHLAPPKMRLILALAAFAGLRCSDIRNLDATDVDLSAMLLRIRQGKGRKDRMVPISELLAMELARYPLPRHGPIVARADGRRYARNSISTISANYLHGIGLADSLHSLRHFFATESYVGTRDIRAVQELLGHSSPTTTSVYVRVSATQTRQAVECVRLPGLASPVEVG